MKRFTQTEKWKDGWFRKLKPEMKLLWLYCLDNCDNAGVIELDREMTVFCIGSNIDWTKTEEVFKNRIQSFTGKNGTEKKWIPALIHFQNGNLNPHSPPHRAVINLLKQYGLMERYNAYLTDIMPDVILIPEQEPEQKELIPNSDDLLILDYAKQAVTMIKSKMPVKQFYHGIADKIGGVKLQKVKREVERILNNKGEPA